MASKGSIARTSELALIRLYQAMADIGTAFPEVEPSVVERYRDPNYQAAARLDAIAGWAERVAVAMGVSSVPVIVDDVEVIEEESDNSSGDYSSFSAKELRAEADARGINTAPLRSKVELIDALEAADGLTEDDQAAKYADNVETG